MKKVFCVLMIAFWLTACATTDDKTKTRGQGAGLGALIGAAAGGAIGYATGGEEGALKGAAIGAAAGAVGGLLYANHVVNQKEKYADKEKWLDACIAQAKSVNEQTLTYNQQLRNDLAKLDLQINALVAEYQQKKSKTAEYKRKEKYVVEKYNEANENLKRAKDEVKLQKHALAEARNEKEISREKIQKMENEIESLENSVAKLDQTTQSLAGSVNNLPT